MIMVILSDLKILKEEVYISIDNNAFTNHIKKDHSHVLVDPDDTIAFETIDGVEQSKKTCSPEAR